MFYQICESRHEQIKLSMFVPDQDVHPVLTDRQVLCPTLAVLLIMRDNNMAIAKTSRREHTGCCG